MSDREVYPNAPLVLVAAEIRHPGADALDASQQAKIKRALAKTLPLSRPVTRTNVMAMAGGPTQMTQATSPRFTSRDRTTSATFHPEAVVVETTRYGQFERLLDLVSLSLDARLAVGSVDGLERIGLRYIDEIRVPEVTDDPTSWAQWVDSSLLGPASVVAPLGLRAAQWQGVAVFSATSHASATTNAGPEAGKGGEDSLVLRYGPGDGYAVDPGGDLKRSAPPPGPYFLLDIDSFWTSADQVPPLDRDELLADAVRLHAPVRVLFESLITERLREEVLRHAS